MTAILNPADFIIVDKKLCFQSFGESDIFPLEFEKGGKKYFYGLRYLSQKYGIKFVRVDLGFSDYKPKETKSEQKQAAQTLQALSKVEIQIEDVTDAIELKDLTNTAGRTAAIVEKRINRC